MFPSARDQHRNGESSGAQRAKVKLPTFKGKGTKRGVDIDNGAALLELMESETEADRHASRRKETEQPR
jgi:hypothetical protein